MVKPITPNERGPRLQSVVEGDQKNSRPVRLSLTQIIYSLDLPRRSIDPESEGEMEASWQEHGQLQPVLVVRAEREALRQDDTDDMYYLVAGLRRANAAFRLGWKTIDARIVDLSSWLIPFVENEYRRPLPPLDFAEACDRVIREHGITQKEFGEKLRMKPSTISEILTLLKLDEQAKHEVRMRGAQLTRSLLLAIARQPTKNQLKLVRRCIEDPNATSRCLPKVNGVKTSPATRPPTFRMLRKRATKLRDDLDVLIDFARSEASRPTRDDISALESVLQELGDRVRKLASVIIDN